MLKRDRGTWWSITINNPTDDDRQALLEPPENVRELIYQDEVGTTGTLHIQGCANTEQTRLASIKAWLPRAHLEVAYKKSGAALKNYCTKSESAVPGTQVHWTRQTARQTNDIDPDTDMPLPAPPLSLKDCLLIIASHCQEVDIAELGLPELYQQTLEHIARVCPDLLEKVTRQNVFQAWKHTGRAFLEYVDKMREYEDSDDDIIMFDECMLCECDKDECTVCA